MIAITILNRQRAVPLDVKWVSRFAEAALPACVGCSGDRAFALREIDDVTVAIVSDRRIAEIHRRFMNIDGATDVITFTEGDVAVSAETARSRAAEFGHRTEEEIALYIVHALLHLNGFDDTTPRAAARMRKVQERIWRAALAQVPPPRLDS